MSEKKVLCHYIVPFVKDGLNVMPDFLNAKKMIRCEDCKFYKGEDHFCDKNILVPFGRFFCFYAEVDHE